MTKCQKTKFNSANNVYISKISRIFLSMLRWCSGQDTCLSRKCAGFDSPYWQKLLFVFWKNPKLSGQK